MAGTDGIPCRDGTVQHAEVRGISADIARILEQVDVLRGLADVQAGELEGAKVYDFNVRWGALLAGRLQRLRHYYRSGELTGEQCRDYLRMEEQLAEVVPLAARIGASRPTSPPAAPGER